MPDPVIRVSRTIWRTTGGAKTRLNRMFTGRELVQLQDVVRQVPVADHVYDYVVNLVHATRPGFIDVPDATKWLQWGAGPRAGQQLILGGKARALLHGRFHVTTDDITALADHARLRIREELATATHSNEAGAQVLLEADPQVLKAIEVMPESKKLYQLMVARK